MAIRRQIQLGVWTRASITAFIVGALVGAAAIFFCALVDVCKELSFHIIKLHEILGPKIQFARPFHEIVGCY